MADTCIHKERPALSSQNTELVQALEEAHTQIQTLQQTLSTKNIENIQLQTENEDLSAAFDAANGKADEYCRLYTEASTRCTLLEEELDAVRRSCDNERREWQQRAKEHQEVISRLQASKQDAEKDRDMFREYYEKASSHVSEMKAKDSTLEEELSVAKSQLSDGLSLLKGMYEERIKHTQAEAERWKSLCKILTEKDERTSDEVRRRAAEAPELRTEVERLKLEVAELQAARPASVPLSHHEPTPPPEADTFYICQYVDVPNACICNEPFESAQVSNPLPLRLLPPLTHYSRRSRIMHCMNITQSFCICCKTCYAIFVSLVASVSIADPSRHNVTDSRSYSMIPLHKALSTGFYATIHVLDFHCCHNCYRSITHIYRTVKTIPAVVGCTRIRRFLIAAHSASQPSH